MSDPEERRHLVENEILDLPGCQRHGAPTEPLKIRIPRVRADAHARGGRHADGVANHRGIARMEAAGDVDGCNVRKKGLVVAHRPRAERLARVGVQVDAHAAPLKKGKGIA